MRCHAVKCIKERFDVIWNYLDHSAAVTDQKARILATQYCKYVNEEGFVNEMRHLPFVHSSNFGKEKLLPLDLLNKFYDFKLQERFPNSCICLRILLTISVTVASAERSFSKLKLSKNCLRATSGQSRVVYRVLSSSCILNMKRLFILEYK